MGLSGPVGRYLLLQQLPAGIDIAVSGGGFRGNDLTGGLYVNGSVALRLNRFLRSRLVRLRLDSLVWSLFIYDRRQGLVSALVSIIHRTRACGRCNCLANSTASNAACASGTVGCAAPGAN